MSSAPGSSDENLSQNPEIVRRCWRQEMPTSSNIHETTPTGLMGRWHWEEQARPSLNASAGRVEKLYPVRSLL